MKMPFAIGIFIFLNLKWMASSSQKLWNETLSAGNA